MVRIMIVTHGPLAQAFKESAAMFFGSAADNLVTLGLFPTDSPEGLKDKIVEKVNEIDNGEGVLVFVDIFAGSPFNMTAMAIDELKENHKIQCFTGVNMPVLMEALGSCETMSLEELREDVASTAQESIVDLRKSLDI
ncbi:PTS sugar transporter subunit IIA [bacterium 1XD21-13]|nr:PTS sugar transporter subunit IIA [bacterium 1XD21-13]